MIYGDIQIKRFIFVLVLAVGLSACTQSAPEVTTPRDELIKEVHKSMRAQVADITKRLKANENGRDTALRSSMLLSRALSYFFLEQYKEGITDIDTMLSMDTHLFEGDMFHAHMLRGVAYIQLAKYDKALSDLLIAESLQKGNVDIYLQLGAIYFQKAEYGLALENYNTAIDLDNYSAKAYAGRAVIYRKLRNEEAANLDDDKAKELGYKPEKKN